MSNLVWNIGGNIAVGWLARTLFSAASEVLPTYIGTPLVYASPILGQLAAPHIVGWISNKLSARSVKIAQEVVNSNANLNPASLAEYRRTEKAIAELEARIKKRIEEEAVSDTVTFTNAEFAEFVSMVNQLNDKYVQLAKAVNVQPSQEELDQRKRELDRIVAELEEDIRIKRFLNEQEAKKLLHLQQKQEAEQKKLQEQTKAALSLPKPILQQQPPVIQQGGGEEEPNFVEYGEPGSSVGTPFKPPRPSLTGGTQPPLQQPPVVPPPVRKLPPPPAPVPAGPNPMPAIVQQQQPLAALNEPVGPSRTPMSFHKEEDDDEVIDEEPVTPVTRKKKKPTGKRSTSGRKKGATTSKRHTTRKSSPSTRRPSTAPRLRYSSSSSRKRPLPKSSSSTGKKRRR